MKNTKIDWAGDSWNPITGCLHTCPFCYARKIANRYASKKDDFGFSETSNALTNILVLKTKTGVKLFDIMERIRDENGKSQPYPWGFSPTFHRYRLEELKQFHHSNVFVGSMSDIFGDWVPDEWITAVFDACRNNPQNNYLFLTKNPSRYDDLILKGLLPKEDNFWYGTSVVTKNVHFFAHQEYHTFLSVEPIHSDFPSNFCLYGIDWVIIGAETGNNTKKVIPQKAWVNHLGTACQQYGVPVFHKSSLKELMGNDYVQNFPKQILDFA